MLNEKTKECLVCELVKELQPAFVLLFGSFAKGIHHENSDIDLAYFSDKDLSNYERFVFMGHLSSLVKREVDLIDLKKVDTVFSIQIYSEGIPIYMADENTFVTQRMLAYRMYANLNEQRAPVIKAIKESRSVFKHE